MSTDKHGGLPVIDAGGSARDIGRRLGRFGARAVHEYLRTTPAWAAIIAHATDGRVTRMRDAVQSRFPDIFAELQGLAEGLELPFDDVFAWNCRGDIASLAPDGCTTVQLPGLDPRLDPGLDIIVAHNEDGDPGLRGACGILNAQPDRGAGFEAFVYPGSLPGHTFGVNDAGLVLTVNNIRPRVMGDGVPRMALARAVLDCASLDSAVTVIHATPRAGAFHLTLAQIGDPRLLSVELTGSHCSVTRIAKPALHANHLIHKATADAPQIVTASSGARQIRGNALLADAGSRIDPIAILHDRHGDLPIYRCDPKDPDGENTLATAMFTIGPDAVAWTIRNAPTMKKT
ncbi:C45 family peptidase [Nguyenibacter sp. L1]|uniref:C45 family peptidase n=1 Tax=Nguyenibacter sp. L1 TaxID=3049350 RepID=UPI002B4A1D3B|nr:C45 family peptidase [Nguyenibacter sp. L1]WRH87572.1 C45 family autoproteolytic acyltransferase/hydrolase [Nguyenibacter sp. L1]